MLSFGFLISALLTGLGQKQVLGAFSDVSSSHPHFEAITYVQDQGIVNGYADGSFKADASINRAEFMKIVILTAVGQEPLEHSGQCFTDVASGDWFYPFICYAERVSIVGGYADGSFKPGQNISFVEAAKIIGNALGDTTGDGSEIWYKPYVEYLAVNKAIPLEVSSFSQELTRGQMAEMIYRIHGKIKSKSSQTYEILQTSSQNTIDEWTKQSISNWGFSFSLPPNSKETDSGQRVRYQNYISTDDFASLSAGEYYLEIFQSDTTKDCQEEMDEAKNSTQLGVNITRGMGFTGGDPGGIRFALCFNYQQKGYHAQATENDQDGPIANAILDSLLFEISSSSNTNTDTSVENNDWGFGKRKLPLGLNKLSTSPKADYIYACNSNLNGGGAHAIGDWINENEEYWSPIGKATVDGNNLWDAAEISIQLNGEQRDINSKGVPTNHGTGNFPVSSSDDAYQYDKNPNTITTQNTLFSIPSNPTVSNVPSCTDLGVIGIATNGVALFNGLDGMGRDAAAYEIQDACDGHPERTGEYHYHNLSRCLEDDAAEEEHSELLGYIIDGFGIYGLKGESGELMKNENLDECHGHSHEIEWDGQSKEMYHYHMTNEFPYTIGCFKGTPISSMNSSNTSGAAPQGAGSGGGAPQAAKDACSGKSVSASCSFSDGNGSHSGSCISTPDGMACKP